MVAIKTIWVLLLSLVLLGSQTVFPACGGSAPAPSACACSDCGQTASCCAKKAAADSRPVSPSALTSSSQISLPLISPRALAALPLPEPKPFSLAVTPSPLSSRPVLPLFLRDCAPLL